MNIAEAATAFKSIVELVSRLSKFTQAILAIAIAVAALAAGWKPVLGFYKWCLSKYDGKILSLFKELERAGKLQYPGKFRNITAVPLPLQEIVKTVQRPEKHVYKSLRRLENAGELEEVPAGWILKGKTVYAPPRAYRL